MRVLLILCTSNETLNWVIESDSGSSSHVRMFHFISFNNDSTSPNPSIYEPFESFDVPSSECPRLRSRKTKYWIIKRGHGIIFIHLHNLCGEWLNKVKYIKFSKWHFYHFSLSLTLWLILARFLHNGLLACCHYAIKCNELGRRYVEQTWNAFWIVCLTLDTHLFSFFLSKSLIWALFFLFISLSFSHWTKCAYPMHAVKTTKKFCKEGQKYRSNAIGFIEEEITSLFLWEYSFYFLCQNAHFLLYYLRFRT